MSRLPIPFADTNNWGAVLNDFLSVGLNVDGTVKAVATVPTDSLRTFGHSYPAGVGINVTSGINDMTTAAAEMLGLPVRNEAVGGTALYSYNSAAANWTNILQKVTRPRRFVSSGGIYLSMYGINDLNSLGNTLSAMQPFLMAQRVAISRWRAGAIFEDTDASVVLGGAGAWSTITEAIPACSGATVQYNATAGATITVTTPADFPGGTIALGFVAWTDAGGATVSGTVNGTVYSINTAATSTAGNRSCSVLRIPNVPAGAASYVFTTSAITGAIGCMFDYWQWEPPEAQCPVVVLVKQPKPLDLTAYGAVAPGPPTNAGIDTMNIAFDNLAAEFGARVITVASTIDNDATCFSAGNVHPNLKGHRIIAEKIRDAVRASFTLTAITRANQSVTAQVLATSGTITPATNPASVSRIAPAAAVTGVILAPGTAGQQVTVINESVAANTVTFASAGTSNVADGAGSAIAGLTSRVFTWDSVTALWYRAS